jgi:integrase
MGSIYKRGDTYWIKYYRGGKYYRESAGTNKESEAKRLLKAREGSIVEGRFVGLNVERIRFDELAEDMLNDYRINAKKSLDRAELSVRTLKRYFEGFRIVDITSAKVKNYIVTRQSDGVSNGTINRELAALKRMLSIGAKQTPPKVVHAPYVSMLKESNPRSGYFEHEEFMRLREALPEYLKPVLTLAYFTGMRREEIAGLTWNQVNIFERRIVLDAGKTKNNEARIIPLTGELFDAILKQKALSDNHYPECHYVFFDEGRKVGDFRHAWATAFKKANLKPRLFHDLRRTAVRNMVRSGIPELVAMRISGHKTRSIFDRYNIINEDDLVKASEKLSGMLQDKEDALRAQMGTITGTMGNLRRIK